MYVTAKAVTFSKPHVLARKKEKKHDPRDFDNLVLVGRLGCKNSWILSIQSTQYFTEKCILKLFECSINY